jgi:hypothetical protein
MQLAGEEHQQPREAAEDVARAIDLTPRDPAVHLAAVDLARRGQRWADVRKFPQRHGQLFFKQAEKLPGALTSGFHCVGIYERRERETSLSPSTRQGAAHQKV